MRTLVESGALVGERGAYRLARPLQAIQVLATVQTILAARIDRLPAEEKRLLQAASVIGIELPFALLQAIAEESEANLRRGLAHLQAAEFLYETNLFPDLEYTVKHALTHDVAYGSLLAERRRTLHASIAESIARLHADRLDEQVEQLAHHALRGGEWEPAVGYLRRAAAKAVARSANREAVARLEEALAALSRLPESQGTREAAIDLRTDLRYPLLAVNELAQISERLREAEALAETLGDQRQLASVLVHVANDHFHRGAPARAVETGERGLAIATAIPDSALETLTTHHLGETYHAMGAYRRAVDLLRPTAAALAGDRAGERLGEAVFPAVNSRVFLALSLGALGEFAEAIGTVEEAVRIAEMLAHPWSAVTACIGASSVCLLKGDLDKAIALATRGLELSQSAALPFRSGLADGLGARAPRTPRRGLAAARAVGRSCRGGGETVPFLAPFGAAGRWLSARRPDRRGVGRGPTRPRSLARAREEQDTEARAFWLLGEIASHRDPLQARGFTPSPNLWPTGSCPPSQSAVTPMRVVHRQYPGPMTGQAATAAPARTARAGGGRPGRS